MKIRTSSFILYFIFLFFLLFYVISSVRQNYKTLIEKDIDELKIDVVYKYIDLKDPNLKREGMHQLEKDYDNEELRYSIRSVLENIPWVNKIYIIMPNERVRFLKDTEERKKKIIYIKDKDILGFDSSSSITFEHVALKNLERYGVSDTFIYMNDDYFVSQPLKKEDFFYYSEEEGRFVPYLMTHSNLTYTNLYGYYNSFYNKHSWHLNQPCTQSPFDYVFQTSLCYKFLYKYFNRTDIKVLSSVYYTWHNSIPLSIKDAKELYEVVKNNYEYADVLLNAKERNNKQMTYEILYSIYFLNKYNRKFGKITKKYYNIHDLRKLKKKRSELFVLNKPNNEVSDVEIANSKFKMNALFRFRYSEEVVDLNDGLYYIHNCYNDSLVFDVEDEYIKLQPLKHKESQQFYISLRKDGYYNIQSPFCNKYVTCIYKYLFFYGIIKLDNKKHKKEISWLFIPFNNSFFLYSMKSGKFLHFSHPYENKDFLLNFRNISTDNNFLFRLEPV